LFFKAARAQSRAVRGASARHKGWRTLTLAPGSLCECSCSLLGQSWWPRRSATPAGLPSALWPQSAVVRAEATGAAGRDVVSRRKWRQWARRLRVLAGPVVTILQIVADRCSHWHVEGQRDRPCDASPGVVLLGSAQASAAFLKYARRRRRRPRLLAQCLGHALLSFRQQPETPWVCLGGPLPPCRQGRVWPLPDVICCWPRPRASCCWPVAPGQAGNSVTVPLAPTASMPSFVSVGRCPRADRKGFTAALTEVMLSTSGTRRRAPQFSQMAEAFSHILWSQHRP
jgi:hypothetical protein